MTQTPSSMHASLLRIRRATYLSKRVEQAFGTSSIELIYPLGSFCFLDAQTKSTLTGITVCTTNTADITRRRYWYTHLVVFAILTSIHWVMLAHHKRPSSKYSCTAWCLLNMIYFHFYPQHNFRAKQRGLILGWSQVFNKKNRSCIWVNITVEKVVPTVFHMLRTISPIPKRIRSIQSVLETVLFVSNFWKMMTCIQLQH